MPFSCTSSQNNELFWEGSQCFKSQSQSSRAIWEHLVFPVGNACGDNGENPPVNFELQIWLESITSRKAKSACSNRDRRKGSLRKGSFHWRKLGISKSTTSQTLGVFILPLLDFVKNSRVLSNEFPAFCPTSLGRNRRISEEKLPLKNRLEIYVAPIGAFFLYQRVPH